VEFFDRFAWAVPHGFRDAVGACRFEEGDLLYCSGDAYEASQERGMKHVEFYMQVRSPSQSLTRAAEDSGVFETNWNAQATIDLYRDGKKVDGKPRPTTHGRIYTAIWTGELDVLDPGSDNPPIPLTVARSIKRLDEAVLDPSLQHGSERAFVMLRDLSNQVARTKFMKVLDALGDHLAAEPVFLAPRETGIGDWRDLAPTIDVAVLPVAGCSRDEVEALVKSAVYVPAEDAKRDMFRLNAHGVVYEWGQMRLI